ncbi:hypothetical protein B0O80DRAFT_416756 [Mortierella sp. GBAus27b]|nr:hypothetical protein B0O80DRAFT_416756 [Mortierella sp. GBAus27b]
MINTVEVYGRTNLKDAHRETFGIQKLSAIDTSLPAADGGDRYPDIRPVTMTYGLEKRLVIGSGTCDILVTSCIRLDSKGPELVSVGGSTTCFSLVGDQAIKNTRIFLDVASERAGHEIMNQLQTTEINGRHGIKQMRQLRSKFDEATTYALCRISGPITRHHVCWPHSIFTVATHDLNRGGSDNVAGRLFSNIGEKMMTSDPDGPTPMLTKATVQHLHGLCFESKIKTIFEEILKLFDHETMIPILANRELSKQLEILAGELSETISRCNTTVATYIKESFEGTK